MDIKLVKSKSGIEINIAPQCGTLVSTYTSDRSVIKVDDHPSYGPFIKWCITNLAISFACLKRQDTRQTLTRFTRSNNS